MTNFGNYIIVSILGLELFGIMLIYNLWILFGIRGFLTGIILTLFINSLVLYYLQHVKVTDNNGNTKNLGDAITDTFSVVVWIIIGTIIIIAFGSVLGYKHAVQHNRNRYIGALILMISIATLFGSVTLVTKVFKK